MRSVRTGRYQCTRAAGDPCGCPQRAEVAGGEAAVEEVEEQRPSVEVGRDDVGEGVVDAREEPDGEVR